MYLITPTIRSQHVGMTCQPRTTTLNFVLVRVIALELTPPLDTVPHDKYKAIVLKNTARLMLVSLIPHPLGLS